MLLSGSFLTIIYFLFHTSHSIECDLSTTSSVISRIFSQTNIETLFPSWWKSSCNICNWNRKYITCSSDSEIIAIQMESIQLTGTLTTDATTYWPSTIKLINLNNNLLTESISWTYLPQSIEYLSLGNNQLDGSINFNALNIYSNLTTLYLSNNRFKSLLLWNEYDTLTPSLKHLFLTNNELYGPIEFNTMPYTLQYCFLGYNNFNESLDFGDENSTNNEIFQFIEYLDVSNNQLTGTIANLENIGENIAYLHINSNDLYANINDILNILSSSDIMDLSLSDNTITGTINWDIFRNDTSNFEYLKSLYIYSNQLSGNIIASALPSSMEKLYFNDNKFNQLLDISMLPSNMQFLIGDNNELIGELDLNFINNNIEYIWLYNNKFTSIKTMNSTSLKQLILSNNEFNNSIDLESINKYLPNIEKLYLDNNLFVNNDNLYFNDIPNNLEIKLDEYLSCDGSVYCTSNDNFNCSISRTDIICMGPQQCADTCDCQFSSNCSLYIDDQDDPNIYYNDNYTINYHNTIIDIDIKYGDQYDDDIWLLKYINIDHIIPIISTTTSTIINTNIDTTTSTIKRRPPVHVTDSNVLADIFGSEAAAYVIFIVGFIVIILLIYGIIKYIQKQQNNKTHANIVHNIKNEEEETRGKFWSRKSVQKKLTMDDNGDTDQNIKSDDDLSPSDGLHSDELNSDNANGLATKYVTLQPIQKVASVSIDNDDAMDNTNNTNNTNEQQIMMQMMMTNTLMMAQMQQNLIINTLPNTNTFEQQSLVTQQMGTQPTTVSLVDPQTLAMQQMMQDLAMQQMTQQMSSMNMSAAIAQTNEQNIDENMPIGPFAQASLEPGQIRDRKSTAVPNLPDEVNDGDTTDGTDTTDDERDMYVNDDYNSPGNDMKENDAYQTAGQTQGVEMQQFSMAPFE